ncbi:MAG: hypothetical protein QOI01_2598, partial [Mycobacterium sp.]|nr:hypothetical protein [Mycobacterium sp.]
KAPGLVASALHGVTTHGFTVAAIDAPGHGDRPRNLQDQRWAKSIHRARAADEPITSIVIDYNMSLAERAVPEWQATLDALQALPEIGVEASMGYGGVSLGVVTGLMLTPVESRIAAVSFGGVFVDDALIEAARKITVPVEYRIPWDDEEFDRTSGVALFAPSPRRRRHCTPTRAGTTRCPNTSATARIGSSPATSAGPPTRLRTDVNGYLRPAPRRTQIPPLPRSCRPGSEQRVAYPQRPVAGGSATFLFYSTS